MSQENNLPMAEMLDNAKEAAEFLKALANEKRLLILCSMLDGELSVKDINERVALSQSALSQHLAGLRKADLVVTRKKSQTVYYSIKGDRVQRILMTMKDIFCPDL